MKSRYNLFALVLLLASQQVGAAVEVSGRVVDQSGIGQSGISVTIAPPRDPLGDEFEQQRSVRTTTDPQGWFRLRAPGPGLWRVIAVPEGGVAAEIGPFPLLQSRLLPELTLFPPESRTVLVFDARHRRIAGAWVVMASARPSMPLQWKPAVVRARTGNDGLVVANMPKGEPASLFAWAPDHSEAVAEVTLAAKIILNLQPAEVGQFEIRSPSGEPAARFSAALGQRGWRLGFIDSKGLLKLPVPGANPNRLLLGNADGEKWQLDRAAKSPIRLARIENLAGRLIDAKSREPIASALVWAEDNPRTTVWSGRDGRFELSQMSSTEPLALRAAAEGYLSRKVSLSREDKSVSGEVLLIALERSREVPCRVRDRSGGSVRGAQIRLVGSSPHDSLGGVFASGRSGSDGRVQIHGLLPGSGYQFEVRAPGFQTGAVNLTSSTRSRPTCEVTLRDGKTAIGSIRDEAGGPIEGAEVSLLPKVELGALERDDLGTIPRGGSSALSSSQGQFEISGVAPGQYDLEIVAEGFASVLVPGIPLITDSDRFDLGEVFLAPETRLIGRVIDTDGIGVDGAVVTVSSDLWINSEAAFVGSSGEFQFGGFHHGQQLAVRVRARGFQSRLLEGVELPMANDLEVELQTACALSGWVESDEGLRIPGSLVSLRLEPTDAATRPLLSVIGDSSGIFEIEGVPCGSYSVEVVAENFPRKTLPGVEIEVNSHADDLIVRLESGFLLSGRVSSRDGAAVAGARLVVQQAGQQISGESDSSGDFRIPGLNSGPTDLLIQHREFMDSRVELTLQGDRKGLEFLLESGVGLSGEVRRSDSSPVSSASLALISAIDGAGHRATSTDAAGRFRFASVPPGKFRVRVEVDGFPLLVSPDVIEVLDVEVEGVLVQLDLGGRLTGVIEGVPLNDLGAILVTAVMANGDRASTTVNYQGSYVFENLPEGDWTVFAELASTGQRAWDSVWVGGNGTETRLNLSFDQSLLLSGTVEQGGEPVAGLVVEAFSLERGGGGHGRTGFDGRFRIHGLTPGTYSVRISDSSGGASSESTFEILTDRDIRLILP